MISNPKHGWCKFQLDNFHGTPSYVTDVPVDLLQAFIDWHTKGIGIAWFDEEGEEFTLVLTPYSLFIIEEKDKPILHDYSEINIGELEKELIDDVERNIKDWACFCSLDDEENEAKQNEIKQLVKKLQSVSWPDSGRYQR